MIPFEKITPKKAPHLIYEQIVEKIASGQIPPGSRLPSERKLMEQFQRSRPTIREALRMLERDGFIASIPGSRGAFVLHHSLASVTKPLLEMLQMGVLTDRELLEFRKANDLNCAEIALTNSDEDDFAKMENTIEQAKAAINNPQLFAEKDIAFHEALAAATHNQIAHIVSCLLTETVSARLSSLLSNMTPEEYHSHSTQIISYHTQTLKALRNRDQKSLQTLIKAQLDAFGDILITGDK